MNTPSPSLQSGYSEPLFLDLKPKWTDERLVTGDKMTTRYHDREKTLRIVNGLCIDIFFRANDIEREDFGEIPDFATPVENYRLVPAKPIDYRKPLDSTYRKRTYTLSKELPPRREERVGPGRGRDNRGPRGNRPGRRRRRR